MIKPISYTTLFAVCAAIGQTLQAQGLVKIHMTIGSSLVWKMA